jgi:hypothetical protein
VSLYAHGHLNLVRHRRHLGLRGTRTTLAADQTVRLALALSPANLAAMRHASQTHYTVKALVEVEATGTNGQRQSYDVKVTLTYR